MAGTEDGTAAGGNGQARLPEAFLEKMKELLGQEYGAFLETYSQERKKGLRLNPLKVTGPSEVQMLVKQFGLWKIPWAEEGYYYDEKARPGKHAWHEAGVFYIQEPSAMAVAEFLEAEPGEKVLDLCAAPGGKTTQIAGKLLGQGLLVSNEIHPARAKILSRNVERMGIANAVVTNEEAGTLADRFPAFFDKIVVDAPCSGEGMFRKDEEARTQWSREHVLMCARRQGGILDLAGTMVRPGGRIVYSTCTFSPEENEGTISAFLRMHEEYNIEETALEDMLSPGRAEWTGQPAAGIGHTLRIWPHLQRGEGHFIARLRKRGGGTDAPSEQGVRDTADKKSAGKNGARTSVEKNTGAGSRIWQVTGDKKSGKLLEGFLREELEIGEAWMARHPGQIVRFGDQIYLMPEEMLSLTGIKVLRPGLQLATEKKNRFEPAHALALSLLSGDSVRAYALTDREAVSYLRGESVACGAHKGWTALFYEGYALGFGKASGGQIKNHYPKGLRKSL